MKAVQNVPGVGVEVVEVDEPEGDGELVRVATVGICASDLLYIGVGQQSDRRPRDRRRARGRNTGRGRGHVRVRRVPMV
jgi:threonine dehydrogenase-like Zn-dependent dehydrogenase